MAEQVVHPTEHAPLLSQEYNVAGPAPLENVDLEVDSSWKDECKLLAGYSLPLIVTYLLQYFFDLVIIYVVAHLGTDELAAVSLGLTTMNILGFAVFEGMATSLDTLCAQAYGSGNAKLVGLHVQRMFLFLLLVAVPVGGLWICSPWILAAIIRQQNLALMAGSFLRCSLVGIPGYAAFEAGKRFVYAQGNFTAPLVVLAISAPIYIFLNWLFVFRLNWGIQGAALAAATVKDIRPIFLLAYIRIMIPDCLQCWPGIFPPGLLHNWMPMIWLTIPGALMTLCEWFAFEILTFSTSYIDTAHLAAQTLLSTTSILVWHIPFSSSVAVSTRIGQLIGKGSVLAAKRLTRLYGIVFVFIGFFDMVILFSLRDHILSVFTQDKVVQQIASSTMCLVALFQFFDAITCCAYGIIRGLGKQAIGGWVSLIVNYAFAVPLALVLELGPPKLELHGVWTALILGLAIITVSQAVVLKFLKWEACVDEARGRNEYCA